MKKIFAMFMVCTILFGLVGCNSSNPKLQDPSFVPLTMTPGETHTSYEGVEIQIDSLIWHEGNLKSSLVVAWNNETKYEVTYFALIERSNRTIRSTLYELASIKNSSGSQPRRRKKSRIVF